jgi:Carboxypeptidase regulatory-like domain
MRFIFFITLIFGAIAFGQNDRGTIAGVVRDPWGVGLTEATVQAKNTQTGAMVKGVSGAGGKYTITDVAAGDYDVSVTVPAIRPFEKKGVAVTAAKTLELNIKLEETTQLSTLGEDSLGAIADRKRHNPPSGPAPRTVDGKPDLSGVWWSPTMVEPGKPEWLPGAQTVAKQRQDSNSLDSPQARCLPSPVTRLGPLFQFAQTKGFLVIISDDESPGFHQIHLDRSTHPKELDTDLWYGDSIGHWEADTLVVDRVGFNERVWLDPGSHPHSDALHVIERYRRPDLGHLEKEVTVEDPGVLAKPWTFKAVADLAAGEEIREFICAENNRDVPHMVGK